MSTLFVSFIARKIGAKSMTQHSLMKSILTAKVLLVCAALALHQGWIKVGDLAVFAEDSSDKNKPSQSKDGEKSAGDLTKLADDKLADDADDKEKAETAKRRSFLSGLFELPKLSAKKSKKEDVGKYMDMAERKERQIAERTTQLAQREEQLKSLEKSLDEKLGKLEEERKFIAKTLQQEKDLKGERVDKIAELFDKMDPKKAAPAFEKLDKDLTVILFKKLKQKQVTTILETMNPDKSVELTEYFARVKSAKEYDILKELNESLRKEFQDCKGMPTASAATSVKQEAAKEAVQEPGKEPSAEGGAPVSPPATPQTVPGKEKK